MPPVTHHSDAALWAMTLVDCHLKGDTSSTRSIANLGVPLVSAHDAMGQMAPILDLEHAGRGVYRMKPHDPIVDIREEVVGTKYQEALARIYPYINIGAHHKLGHRVVSLAAYRFRHPHSSRGLKPPDKGLTDVVITALAKEGCGRRQLICAVKEGKDHHDLTRRLLPSLQGMQQRFHSSARDMLLAHICDALNEKKSGRPVNSEAMNVEAAALRNAQAGQTDLFRREAVLFHMDLTRTHAKARSDSGIPLSPAQQRLIDIRGHDFLRRDL